MSENHNAIFRPEALAKYQDKKVETVLPKFIRPGLFPKLWLMVLACLLGLCLVAVMPITTEKAISADVLADHLDEKGHIWLGVSPLNAKRLLQGEPCQIFRDGQWLADGHIEKNLTNVPHSLTGAQPNHKHAVAIKLAQSSMRESFLLTDRLTLSLASGQTRVAHYIPIIQKFIP